jgi:hypothetical protein
MDNPVFKVGMAFADVKELRSALTTYNVRNRVKINKPRNEKIRLEAVCKEGCTWMLKASKDSMKSAFLIRAYEKKITLVRKCGG